MTTLPLSELLGATVYDASGAAAGRVREVTLAPQEDRDRIASFIVKTKSGNRVIPFSAVSTIDANIHASTKPLDWPAANGSEGLFLLERDLLDQQVSDVPAVAAELADEGARGRVATQRKRGEIDPGGPALGPPHQISQIGVAERDPGGPVDKRRRLGRGEPQLAHPQLDHVAG